jgi:hypothetical protein
MQSVVCFSLSSLIEENKGHNKTGKPNLDRMEKNPPRKIGLLLPTEGIERCLMTETTMENSPSSLHLHEQAFTT